MQRNVFSLYFPPTKELFIIPSRSHPAVTSSIFCRIFQILLLCRISSHCDESLPQVEMNVRPSNPPNEQREPDIDIWKQTTLCARSSQRGERRRLPNELPTSATMHIIISMFDLLAEIILATPPPTPEECQLFCRVISRRSESLSAWFDCGESARWRVPSSSPQWWKQ